MRSQGFERFFRSIARRGQTVRAQPDPCEHRDERQFVEKPLIGNVARATYEQRLQRSTELFHTQNTNPPRALWSPETQRIQSIAAHNALTWEIVVPATRRDRGSPFQMPARLAVGLGPESDRANGSHSRSPRPDCSGIGSPAPACRKASQLRLQLKDQ